MKPQMQFKISLDSFNDALNLNWLRYMRHKQETAFMVLPIEVTKSQLSKIRQRQLSAVDYTQRLAYCFMIAFALGKNSIVDQIKEVIYSRHCYLEDLLDIEEALNILFMYVAGEEHYY